MSDHVSNRDKWPYTDRELVALFREYLVIGLVLGLILGTLLGVGIAIIAQIVRSA